MNSNRAFEWQLGSWIGIPPSVGWVIFTLAAVAGVTVAAWAYRHTLRVLTPRQRLTFVILRSGFFLCLLLCLAGPARVERVFDSSLGARPLAVLVDRSGSMTAADNHGSARLPAALRVWKKVETEAVHAFPSLRYFRFSETSESVPDLEAAINGKFTGGDTHLFQTLDQVMKDAPPGGYGGIVCLTDGLDTSDLGPEETISRSLQGHSPLYFCVGPSRATPPQTLLVREFDLPGQVLRKSQFSSRVVVEAQSGQDRDVPVSLTVDGQPLTSTTMHLHRGANLIPWTVPVNSPEPGLMHLTCTVGEGAEKEAVSAAVRVVGKEKVHILFYQGSLDWAFRFVRLAIQSDPTFSLTGLFSPDLNLTRELASSSDDVRLTEMPDKADGLKSFQIVVLSNVLANQMTPAQQNALADYVHGGGGVLFLVTDTAMASTFSGSVLEGLMPVIFESSGRKAAEGTAESQFQDQMRAINYRVNSGMEGEFAREAKEDSESVELKFFAFPPKAKHSEVADLFGASSPSASKDLPQFVSYARVHGVKAGSEVIAIHPDDKVDGKEPRALLVTQRFGEGHVTALLTDGLWRWKLTLPATSHVPEIFWQQLFHALAGKVEGHDNLRFGLQPFFATLGQTSDFRLNGAGEGAWPKITAFAPSGAVQALEVRFDPQARGWAFQLKPNEAGKWLIRAEDTRGAQIETWLRVAGATHSQEMSGLSPDADGLRRLAMATGGSLLDDGVPESWAASGSLNLTTLISKRSEPLWDRWYILLAGLGFYVTELIWRRSLRLL